MKNYDENSEEGYILELMFNIQKYYVTFMGTYHFYLKKKNPKSRKAYN